ncbi:MAG: helix-turn-helix domain-containing protein [Saprospiraceae bacterium]
MIQHGRPKTTALKANRIIQMAKDGYNKSQIPRELGISRTSVRRALNAVGN